MIILRAIVWAEEVRDWKKSDHEITVATYQSRDIRCVAASDVSKLVLRVHAAATEIQPVFADKPTHTRDVPILDRARPVPTSKS